MVTPTPSGWRCGSTTTWARSTTSEVASFELRWFRRRRPAAGDRAAGHPGRVFRKAGLGKDVTDKFLAGLPGIRRKAATASSPARAGSAPDAAGGPHRLPGVLRQPEGRRAGIVEITDYLFAETARGVKLAGLEHLDDRYLRAVGYATKSKKARPAEDGADRRHRRRRRAGGGARASEVVRIANAAAAKASSPSAPTRARNSGSTASAPRPSRHTNAFKVNGDVVIPLPRMGDYCDGIERINIELSPRNKLELCDAGGGLRRTSSPRDLPTGR